MTISFENQSLQNSQANLSNDCRYCHESDKIFREHEDLSTSEGYFFGFSSAGKFTIITQGRESLVDSLFPVIEKVFSNFFWILFWGSIAFLFSSHAKLCCILMGILFLHLFLLGCRLTELLLKKGLKLLIFPPLWERISRSFEKGEGIEILIKNSLETHPGLLVNLALCQRKQHKIEQSLRTLRLALAICPLHPVINALNTHWNENVQNLK